MSHIHRAAVHPTAIVLLLVLLSAILVLSSCTSAPGGANGGTNGGTNGVADGTGAGGQTGSGAGAGDKPVIVAQFYPLAWFAEQIVGECAQVVDLTPPGSEPHDLDPTPADVKRLVDADVILTQGAGFQPAVDEVIRSNHIPAERVVDVTAGMERLSDDPHLWLDPVRAKQEADNMATALVRLLPSNCRSTVESNRQRLGAELDQLHQEYSQQLAPYRGKPFVTSHAAFTYLADRYGLRQVPILGVAPEAEPSPQTMQRIVEQAKAAGVRVVFFESLVNPRLSEAIARDINASTMVLNPIEGLTKEQARSGADYLSLMRENLHNLFSSFEAMGGTTP